MPRIVDKSAMRQRILQAAMERFAARGYHATKMAEIADAAGLAKGTLYLYFPSKEALTCVLVDDKFARLEARFRVPDPIATRADFLAQLSRLLDPPAGERAATRMFFEVLGPSFGSDEVRARIGAFFARLGIHFARQIDTLQHLGQVSGAVDPAATGRALAAMADGLVTHRALFAIEDEDHARMRAAALALIGQGLAPHKQ